MHSLLLCILFFSHQSNIQSIFAAFQVSTGAPRTRATSTPWLRALQLQQGHVLTGLLTERRVRPDRPKAEKRPDPHLLPGEQNPPPSPRAPREAAPRSPAALCRPPRHRAALTPSSPAGLEAGGTAPGSRAGHAAPAGARDGAGLRGCDPPPPRLPLPRRPAR